MSISSPTYLCAVDMESPSVDTFANGNVAWYSHRSPARATENEDSLALVPINKITGVLAVADGLGGHVNGATASRTVVESFESVIHTIDASDLRSTILNAIEFSNQNILQNHPGAATTLAMVEISDKQIKTYHAGDSIILVTGQRGKRKLLTTAHSPVGYAVESGMLDENDAIHHEARHLVSNVIGSPEMSIEMGTGIKLAARDTLLIASDGLTDNLFMKEIINTIRIGPLEQCAQSLLKLAHARMLTDEAKHPHHPDDLSFILYRPN